MKLISWNVNGIRAIMKKDFSTSLKKLDADILCLQETRASVSQVETALEDIRDYHIFVNESKARKGYAGTAILSKIAPITVTYDMNLEEHDQEGRVVTAEYAGYYLVCVYVPNSGQAMARLPYRQQWDQDFLAYLKRLEEDKPVIVCGDLNVAHQPIDLARPAANYNKSSGYTQQEIDGFSAFMEGGLVDTYRNLHPEEVGYTWWSFRMNARAKNIGWRIDYFLVSTTLMSQVKDAYILPEILGSDHCPVGIDI